ncbi:MAG: S41 family peptidase [Cohnella sp.]|nr:S41 family peptidase [Cohnella sp.]
MWLRGRTVLSLMVLTAVAAGMTTYAALRYPGFLRMEQPSNEPAAALPEYGINEKELFKINKAYELIRNRFLSPADRERILDGAIHGMVESLNDPYSEYKSKTEAESESDELQGAFTGIGANLSVAEGAVVVESIFKGSPAERAGLLPNDILLSVNGESLQGLTLSEAVAKIRGPKGTKAKLSVKREGIADPIDLELVRDRIDRVTVYSEFPEEGIGYLAIRNLNADTASKVAEEMAGLEKGGLQALVIDLRDNPGGMVQIAELIASQFIPVGKPIAQYGYKDGTSQTIVVKEGPSQPKPYPIIVLVNKETASAAELLAGALKASAGASLIGERTYGKGLVQISFDKELEDGSMIKLTVSKWMLPDGTWINGTGISPDTEVKQPDYFAATQLPRDNAIKFDQAGQQVANLQAILEGVGFPADRRDGYFSQATQDALEAFQRQEGLQVTGEADAATAQRLEEVLYDRLQQKENDAQRVAAVAKAHDLIRAGN